MVPSIPSLFPVLSHLALRRWELVPLGLELWSHCTISLFYGAADETQGLMQPM